MSNTHTHTHGQITDYYTPSAHALRVNYSYVVVFSPTIITLHNEMGEAYRYGGPDEGGMWTSHYLEGMGYECIRGSHPVDWGQIQL